MRQIISDFNLRHYQKTMKTPALVLVEWLDSHYNPGWTTEPLDNPKPVLCRSVGWLTKETGEAKVISSHMTDESEPQRCGDMTIPLKAIVKIRKLR